MGQWNVKVVAAAGRSSISSRVAAATAAVAVTVAVTVAVAKMRAERELWQ